MPTLYIIAGCNGAGKTTASETLLPEILGCKEFVNADAIAAGLSPFQPETVAFLAGRLMLERINQLLNQKVDFAIETTLSTKSYVNLVKQAQEMGYSVSLTFFWLNSIEEAILRIKKRVQMGGHHIQDEVVHRRYKKGLINLQKLFIPIVDQWCVFDNSGTVPELIAECIKLDKLTIHNSYLWSQVLKF